MKFKQFLSESKEKFTGYSECDVDSGDGISNESTLLEAIYELTVLGDDTKKAGKSLRELGVLILSQGYREGSAKYMSTFKTTYDKSQIENALKDNTIDLSTIKLGLRGK